MPALATALQRVQQTLRASRFAFAPILLISLFGLLGCASGPAASGSGTPTRLLLRDYRTMQEFELVNDAYEDRVAYYSQKRKQGEAQRKFQSDRMLNRMLEVMDTEGWGQYSQEGRAPRDGATVITSAFELERDGKTTHWKIGEGSVAEMRRSFVDCKKAFIILYQETPGFQSVENAQFSLDGASYGQTR